jgi:hypothetical protein
LILKEEGVKKVFTIVEVLGPTFSTTLCFDAIVKK